VEVPWAAFDWRELTDAQRELRLAEMLEADRLRGFSIGEPLLMRSALIRLDATAYQFLWTHHHLLTDAWCLPILLNEAMAIYEGLLSERQGALDTGRPFRDYIQWLARQDREAAASFWREHLDGFTSP